jgi:hypothetical protein
LLKGVIDLCFSPFCAFKVLILHLVHRQLSSFKGE